MFTVFNALNIFFPVILQLSATTAFTLSLLCMHACRSQCQRN